MRDGLEEDALEWLKKSLYLDSDFVFGHIQLAHVLHYLGRHEESKRTLWNAGRLLEKIDADLKVPFADGRTAGELLSMIRESVEENK